MIRSIHHIVLTTRDADQCVAFYTRVLGMELETFGNGRLALHSVYVRDPDQNLVEIAEPAPAA
ncbi:MAG: VOC family protein [Betaproteobacteria bacterium]|nr:VOC family protein [Betaproteobacteria bacterium]